MSGLRDRLIALVVALGSLVLGGLDARAQGSIQADSQGNAQRYQDALTRFTADSFDDTDAAISAVAASGNAQAIVVIRALQDGRLLFSADQKKVYIRDADGAILDAATGTPTAAAPADLKPVRINNRLRRSIDAALGNLTLLAADPARRLEAARAVFKSKDASVLPTIETALAKETDAPVKRAMNEARAAVILFTADAKEADKIEAVAVIRQRGDQEALALLSSLPAQTPAAVLRAAGEAMTSIQNQLAIWETVQNAWYGLSLGSVLLLAAIGLAITFGVMGVINMAHGEMIMTGAYVAFVVQQLFRTFLPIGLIDAYLVVAVPVAFLFAGLLGVLLERCLIRFLYGRPLETLLATWGVSLILQQAVRSIFGSPNKEVSNPSWMTGGFDVIGGFTVTWNRLYIIVFCFVVLGVLALILNRTRFGLHMRAVTQNRDMAAAMGIPTARVDALTFGLGSGIAGMAGVALSQIGNVSPNLGTLYIVDSFMVVVFGGVGNLMGTLVGALSLGIVNKLLEPYAGAILGKIAMLVAT